MASSITKVKRERECIASEERWEVHMSVNREREAPGSGGHCERECHIELPGFHETWCVVIEWMSHSVWDRCEQRQPVRKGRAPTQHSVLKADPLAGLRGWEKPSRWHRLKMGPPKCEKLRGMEPPGQEGTGGRRMAWDRNARWVENGIWR